MADPNSSAKVVQVLDADGTKPYGLFFTIPAERVEPASSPEVRFMETASGTPAAIRTWWYPGERRGYEFIFPKEQARRLAMGQVGPCVVVPLNSDTIDSGGQQCAGPDFDSFGADPVDRSCLGANERCTV